MNSVNNDSQNVFIAGIGLVTALGPNVEMTAAAVKAGVSAYRISDYTDNNDKPITMANVPIELFTSMDIEIERISSYREQYDHIIKMAILAVQEAFTHITNSEFPVKQPIPLVLAMPEPQLNITQMPPKLLIKNILKLSGAPIDAQQVRCVHNGRAAGIQTLDLARRFLFDQQQDFVLIGGSDSHNNLALINQLNQQKRLLTHTSRDAFAPGEAASFLLLTRHAEYALNKNHQIIKLHPQGIAEEAGHLTSDIPYRGDGLDQAFKQALSHYNGDPIGTIYSSMNGENFWAKEQGVAIIRNKKYFKEDMVVEHPADTFGDLGVATATALMGLSATALFEQKQPTTHLVYSSSDGPARASLLLEKITYHQNNKNAENGANV